jgi:folylpolyglutamate synthase/dihydropteroate synthase
MSYVIFEYPGANNLMEAIDAQFGEHLVVKMENYFEKNLIEADYKKREKATKAFNRSVQEVRPFCAVIVPMQIRMTQIRINLRFLLEQAHNKVSYSSLAEDFAEYDFLSKEIKKEAKKCKNEAMTEYLKSLTVLESDFFKTMMDTMEVMQKNIQARMKSHSEQYIDLDEDEDSWLDADKVKASFKDALKKLKKDKV